MRRVLVTGASGFIGSALVDALAREGMGVRAAYRKLPPIRAPDSIAVGALGPETDWSRALVDVTHVVHCASPAHRRIDEASARREIVAASDALARQAEAAGVARFVLISSVKAAAERGGPLTEMDAPAPEGAYGRAKLEAERALLARSSLAPVVLRPPLVFSVDAKANFASLLRLADTPLPLPLGGIANRRSLIARETLIAAILSVLHTPKGPPGAFFVADHPACSTTEMVSALRAGMGRPARLFPMFAPSLLPAVLTESLEVDDSAFRSAYAFTPGDDARNKLRQCGAEWAARR